MVASRGHGGPLNLAGLAQSSTIMFFLGIFAIYYMTTGMVFAKTREGYTVFWRVCIWTGFSIILIQTLLCIPALSHLLFGRIIGLPPSIEQPARITFLTAIPLQFLFFWRIPYQVAMYNGRATGRASLATMGRIILTAVLVYIFPDGRPGLHFLRRRLDWTHLGRYLSDYSGAAGVDRFDAVCATFSAAITHGFRAAA
jgi:hypothetical protein